MGKPGNGTMKRSEESITRMTSYRFPHHDNRSFAAASDNVLPPLSPRQQTFNHILDNDFPSAVILSGGKNALWENRETER